MTPEEALEVCKLARDRIIDDDGYLNTVIQALEKQVPKKPKVVYARILLREWKDTVKEFLSNGEQATE